jgi:hypothetical protein
MPEANTFEITLLIKSISPKEGSMNGGTLVTITGENFS